MATKTLPPDTITALNELFTHAFYSAAGYVRESQPFTTAEDADLLATIEEIRADDRRHATLLAKLVQVYDLVPESGAFPYWYQDLNYLTVPHMAGFVVDCLRGDLARYDAAARVIPDELRLVHATLQSIRREKAERLEALVPLAEAGRVREAQRYADEAAAVAKVRNDRLAAEKAAADAARKAAAAARAAAKAAPAGGPALLDPDEEGISAKEKARRTMLMKRAQKAAAAAPAPAGGPALLDPNEEGISAKEKAKRTMMIKRAQKAAAAAAPAAPAADPAAGMPDPNEEGISPKEKAKRTMMIKRAQKAAAGAPAPADSPAADADPAAGMPDPDEPGISAKEKAKRTMMIKRARNRPKDD